LLFYHGESHSSPTNSPSQRVPFFFSRRRNCFGFLFFLKNEVRAVVFPFSSGATWRVCSFEPALAFFSLPPRTNPSSLLPAEHNSLLRGMFHVLFLFLCKENFFSPSRNMASPPFSFPRRSTPFREHVHAQSPPFPKDQTIPFPSLCKDLESQCSFFLPPPYQCWNPSFTFSSFEILRCAFPPLSLQAGIFLSPPLTLKSLT